MKNSTRQPQSCDVGIAFDLGSTTLVGYLCTLGESVAKGRPSHPTCVPAEVPQPVRGSVSKCNSDFPLADSDLLHCILATKSRLNPQTEFGADILSRVSFSAKSAENRARLRDLLGSAVVEMAEALLREICAEYGSDTFLLTRIVMVGNPVILGSIRNYDFREALTARCDIVSRASVDVPEVFATPFLVSEDLQITLLPPVGNYVGADALAGAYVLERTRAHKNILLLDIGTNGELILLTDQKKLAASAAAGPAMEGGNISCGMRGGPGAVDFVSLTAGVSVTSDLVFHVIDSGKATGLCGSGLLSLIQTLLTASVIDNTGYLRSAIEALSAGCPRKIAERIIEHNGSDSKRNNKRYFRLTEAITLTQEDIHKLQLAVSALRTAAEMLFREASLTESVIDEFHLAGAFGNYITIDSVRALGILPDVPRERIRQSGNLAGLGAVLCLLSDDAITDVTNLKKELLTVPLAEKAEFQELFLRYMNFLSA